MRAHTHTHARTSTQCVHACTYATVYTRTHVRNAHTHVRARTHTQTHTHAYTGNHTHVHAHTRVHTHGAAQRARRPLHRLALRLLIVLPPSHCSHWDLLIGFFKPRICYGTVQYILLCEQSSTQTLCESSDVFYQLTTACCIQQFVCAHM